MDTSALKEFAAETRRELTQGVSARLDTVLLPGSAARLDFPVLVGKLERAIEETSREAVVDRVTYLWFNRFVALRFMDACGYTPVGVVSPAEGVDPMQAPPQIVSDAFAGVIDTDIVGAKVAQQVNDVVSGVRRSQDQYSEVFALLLDAYAQHFKSWVPAMFPDADDISNLLLPANLLSVDSVVRKVAQSMTPEMCQDVEVIGWLYQFYIAERKDEVFEGFKKGVKAGAEQIPAATQLFTPDWIVRYLVQNTVGRTWLLNRPGSALRQQMEYFVEPVGGLESVEDFVRITSPEELTVLDPAVGSGHMLTYAFDLLYEMYLEDGYAEADIPGLILGKNLVGLELDERAGALAAFALTMKARGRYRRFFRRAVQPSICVLKPVTFSGEELRELARGFDFTRDYAGDGSAQPVVIDEARFGQFWNTFEHADVFGSLIRPDAEVLELMEDHWSQHVLARELPEGALDVQVDQSLKSRTETALRQARLLSQKYTTVVANPPYMGKKNMGEQLKSFIVDNFPGGKDDLFSAFIYRNLAFSISKAACGFMTPFVWMFISSYERVRREILKSNNILSLVQLEYSGFAEATVPICTFVLQKDLSGYEGVYINLKKYVGPKNQPVHTRRIISDIRENGVSNTADSFSKIPESFKEVPGSPIIFELTDEMLKAFTRGEKLKNLAEPRVGLQTGNNSDFVRLWYEVSADNFGAGYASRDDAQNSGLKWFPYNKGGKFRKWYGNQDQVVNWENDGAEIRIFGANDGKKTRSRVQNSNYYFQPSISWSKVGSGESSFRYFPAGFLFDVAGTSIFIDSSKEKALLSVLNSSTIRHLLSSISPTMNLEVGTLAQTPFVNSVETQEITEELTEIHKADWDSSENSWDFTHNAICQLAASSGNGVLAELVEANFAESLITVETVQELEKENNFKVANAYGITHGIEHDVPADRVTLLKNPYARYGTNLSVDELRNKYDHDTIKDLISYFVGVLFGRYSLDAPGLILANQGETLADYLTKIGTDAPTFIPDEDNVIPVLADDRFEDDIVAKFKAFLKKAFGEENLEANLAFVESALGKNIRKYFTDEFFKDHLKRYSKRPIYWMFSSTGNGKGSFKALVYMHRYTPATVSTVLNDYLRPYMDKLTANREHLQYTITHGEGAEVTKAQKEDDKLGRVLKELTDYQDNVLYPLALQNKHIDLDDGVAHNYPLLGKALISFK
ncbi:BREX-1 system adenine-specific DNA-methyltransferase PglX [Rothia endophytica]|uniref:BREX-1 system adenine-specific DNA-methyltransferase PglX n=1 Tax=Rothia endophytica TaxID=1324766 RepID=UPI0031EA65AC